MTNMGKNNAMLGRSIEILEAAECAVNINM
jgi:hypothetical protein